MLNNTFEKMFIHSIINRYMIDFSIIFCFSKLSIGNLIIKKLFRIQIQNYY